MCEKKQNDIIYTDFSSIESGAHIDGEKLSLIFPEEKRKQVITMHFSDFASINLAKSLGFKTADREYSKKELLKLISSRS